MADLQKELQRLSGSTLDAAGAANRWAGTSGLELVGALNVKAGTGGLGLAGVLRRLGRDLDPNGALAGTDPAGLSYVTNVIRLPGTVGNYVSTPDSAALSITGDIDLRAKVAPTNLASGSMQMIIAKDHSDPQRAFRFVLSGTGTLQLVWFPTGSLASQLTVSSTVTLGSIGVVNGQTIWLRVTLDVDNGAAGRTTTFYTSTDGTNWTQLGTQSIVAGATTMVDTTGTVEIGSRLDGANDPFGGAVHYAEIRNGIGGTAVATFDPSGQGVRGVRTPSSWTGPQGNVWTVNGTGWSWTTSRATA